MSEEMQKLREQSRKIMERLREINQNEKLRIVSREAGEDEGVQKARERVRKAQEALQKAQQNSMRVLDRAILNRAKEKGDKELIKLVQERRELTEKLRELRQEFPRPTGRRPFTGTSGPRPPRGGPGRGRPRAAAES
jgi:hypothetical protein